jgi:hypothetical protein
MVQPTRRWAKRRAIALQTGESDWRDGCRPRQKGRRIVKSKPVPDNGAFVTSAVKSTLHRRHSTASLQVRHCSRTIYTSMHSLRVAEKQAHYEVEDKAALASGRRSGRGRRRSQERLVNRVAQESGALPDAPPSLRWNRSTAPRPKTDFSTGRFWRKAAVRMMLDLE